MLKAEKFGYKFYQKKSQPFPLTKDQCVGILTAEQAEVFIRDNKGEQMISKKETVTDMGTEIVILKSATKKVAHTKDKLEIIEGASSVVVNGLDYPTIIVRDGAFYIISPLIGWIEEINDPHYRNAPDKDHLQVRYHCGSCHKRLEPGSDIYLEPPFAFFQTVFKPCKEHPDAGFYVIFAK